MLGPYIFIHHPRVAIQRGYYSIKLPWQPVILENQKKTSKTYNIYVCWSFLPATFVTTSSNIISSNAKEFMFLSLSTCQLEKQLYDHIYIYVYIYTPIYKHKHTKTI